MDFVRALGEVALGSRFKMISDLLYSSVDSVYKDLGIEFQSRWFLFLYVLHENGEMGVTDIAKMIGQTHSAVSQTSNVLMKKDVIVACKDKQDERRRLLSLSKKGESLYTELLPIFDVIKKSMTQIILDANIDLINTISALETQLEKTPFHEVISKRLNMKTQSAVEIIPFSATYRNCFKELNVEWLKRYFYVEEFDNEVLSNPEKYILDPGGFIFFAKYNNEIVGTCALMKDDINSWELTKMAVTNKYQGLKIGEKLAKEVIAKFESFSKGRLFLETNSKLIPAVRLYEKLGFVQQPKIKEGSHYSRANVYMIYNGAK